jgi:hypothetical protein
MGLLAVLATCSLGMVSVLANAAQAHAAERIVRMEEVAYAAARSDVVAGVAAAESALVSTGNAATSPLGAVRAMAPIPLCDTSSTVCHLSGSASYTVAGESDVIGSAANVTSSNVERADGVWERRVAVDVDVSVLDDGGHAMLTRRHRVIVRAWAQPPYAELLGEQDSASVANEVVNGAADTGGCATTGAGCDPQAPGAGIDSTLDPVQTCLDGPNSGSCPPSGQTPAPSDKQSPSWNDPDANQAPY